MSNNFYFVSFPSAGIQIPFFPHRLWAITDAGIVSAIQRRFTDTKLYIADGHHRYETALRYRDTLREQGILDTDAEYVMMMLVEMSHPGLVVFPTHRMIRDVKNFDAARLLADSAPYFDIRTGVPLDALDESLEHAYTEGRVLTQRGIALHG